MKTLLLLIVITVFYLPTMGQCKYEINGYIKNIDTASNKAPFNQGTNIILRFLNFKKSDTVQLSNHTFKFKGDVPEPSVAMIDYPSGGVKVLIDSNSYNVYLKEVQIDKTHYTYKDTIITRSKYFNLWSSFGDNLTLLYQNKSKLLNEIDKTRNTDSISNLKIKINEIDEKKAYYYKEVAINNPGNYAIAYFLSAAPDFSYKNYIDIYNVLSEKVKNSYYGKKLFEKLNSIKVLDSKDENGIAEIVKENELITIHAIDPTKKTVELNKKFYKRNKYTLIDFWASWCSPCRKTNIDIRAKQDAYLKKGLLIVGFSLDTDFNNWKEAIKTDKTDWLQISDLKGNESPIAKYLKLTVIPSNVLLNSRGEIIARNITLQELDNLLL